MQDRITAAIEAALAAGNIPGAVALVGNSAGTLAEAAVGTAGPGGPPLTTGHLFQIASMTKALTSVAALQQVEEGRLSLDADIASVLPELANPEVLDGFASDGTPVRRPAAGPITLRQLLTHTSGLGYEFMSAELARYRQHHPAAPGTLASLGLPLLADPGTQWIYGISTDWVGLAVERVTGRSLGQYFHDRVTGPMLMADTTFAFDAAIQARLVPLHARTPDGALVPFPVHFNSTEYDAGGAGLKSTASDYLTFCRMILKGGVNDAARLLKAGTIAEMTRNQVPMPAGRLTTSQPGFSTDFDLFPGMDCGFGLGFLINPAPGPDGRAAGSLAWAGIANSYYWIDRENDIAAVLMMQHLPFGEPAALNVLRSFERAVYDR